MGKQTKWGELDTLEFATSEVRSKIEKEHISQSEVKAQLEQWKKLLVEMGKSLDSRVDDTLPSISLLPECDMRIFIEIRKVAAITKIWAQDNASKIRMFL